MPQFSNQHSEYSVNSEKIPSLEGWIKGFADADFIITDSFHGTLFSIFLNKPFVSLLTSDRCASCFYSILNEFGLEDRLVTEYGESKINALLNQEIYWQKVNEQLEILKQSSRGFLQKELG